MTGHFLSAFRPTVMESTSKPADNIRASCDNCSRSKVRCSKDHPRCQRCIYQGVSCIYSPSQRPRKRPYSAITFETRMPKKLSPPPPPPPSLRPPPPPPLPLQQQDALLFTSEVDGLSMVEGMMPWREPDALTFSVTAGPPPPSAAAPSMTDSSTAATAATLSTSSPCWPRLEFQPEFTDPLPPFWLPDHCAHLATSTLQRLELPPSACSLRISASPPPTPGATVAMPRSLDTVLQENSAAMDTLFTIVNCCSCAGQADIILSLTTIACRMLAWYQASLDGNSFALQRRSSISRCCSRSSRGSDSPFPSCPLPSSTAASSSSLSSTPASPACSLAEWVSIPSINIGAYTLNAEHCDRMVAQLVLTELVKVNKFLDLFAAKYCIGLAGAKPDPGMAMYAGLETFLRSRLRVAVVTAREQLEG
ncbi:hypothetical protein ASPZODRAFT_318487 [Penicilliopsis zonata CBS 506.65]|uniref:Zn(2)-C6 fungal-type domain-containing protein n=1 Tax=Penicilliopsis zonata CBS 506.65 TaxID=1073090 RepID=A0A1L9SV78_9EURO|nr:hypothetical protein ASPZODRAFT_318487 [Penicilliopsis zonata CBS 506.65]OJJ51099.1 hypothetical protein ASPZODRAFT_318487 [Penicilliopsis zonata CBS 506.65]